ncbi:MAG TPA: hypothetical protein VIK73_01340 [Limnochordales bacterium]
MHDERQPRRHVSGHHDHGQTGCAPASTVMPGADAGASESSANRWIAPIVFGAAAAILYFILR